MNSLFAQVEAMMFLRSRAYVPLSTMISRCCSRFVADVTAPPSLSVRMHGTSVVVGVVFASLTVQIFNYAISPYEDWHDKAWGAALCLLLVIGTLSILARVLQRRKEVR